MIPPTIQHWHRIALENLPHELPGIIAEGCVFESPVVHTPQQGKAITVKYLSGALAVLNTEHFRYGDEWFAPNADGSGSAVLEFYSELDGIKVNGVDLIHWNADGLITRFKVMARPLKGINALHQKMGEYLTKNAG